MSVPLVIGGKDIADAKTYSVTNPSTGQIIHEAVDATAEHASMAVEAAAKAFPAWSQTTVAERRNIFLKATQLLESRKDELAEYMKSETGSDDIWVAANLKNGSECLYGCASRICTIEGSIPSLANNQVGGLIVKEPYGVIYSMVPWNAPYALGFRGVAWAIAAGNTVVYKGSELSPRTLWAVSSVLHEAGLPPGVLNFISSSPNNGPAVAEAIIKHPEVKKINFTGSSNVGRIIAKMAGEQLKPTLMELGGKAPAIVCADADLDVAARETARGSFLNTGQICMSTERIIVHESIRDAFEAKLRDVTGQMFSSSRDAPVLIMDKAVHKNKTLMRDAVGKGAKIIFGDVNHNDASASRMRPIIISDVTPDMTIYKEESFGPTVSIISYTDDEEALAIANDTEYGLASSIFSTDLRKALRLARQIETGAVHINRMSTQDEAALPHGGAKASGFGRFNGVMDEWIRTKNITYDL